MGVEIICGLVVLVFSAILAMAGMGAAFIFIPFFFWLGIPLEVAIPTGLFVNGLGLTAVSVRNIRKKLVPFHLAIPIAAISLLLAPVGAYTSKYFDRATLLWLFTAFLIFAAFMILFYKPKCKPVSGNQRKNIATGLVTGAFAGFISGLLGVGGGGLISPVLVCQGHGAKKVAAATAFIVPFSSYTGFFTYLAMGHVQMPLLFITGVSAVLGALVGTWFMNEKMKTAHVKKTIGVVILIIAAKILYGLLFTS